MALNIKVNISLKISFAKEVVFPPCRLCLFVFVFRIMPMVLGQLEFY